MHFSENDLERFAAWSGDHNPLHVDPQFAREAGFPRPTVHGMLQAIGALGAIRSRSLAPISNLEIDFRGAVLPDSACDSETVLRPNEISIALVQDGVEVALLRGDIGRTTGCDSDADLSWFADLEASPERQQAGRRTEPADPDVRAWKSHKSDFRNGPFAVESIGAYVTDPPPDAATANGYFTPVQARVLGLCSYLAGMEFPGRRSWLTRVSLRFCAPDADENVIWYRASAHHFDRSARLLHTLLEVATPDGRLVAAGELQSYVRFGPVVTDLDALAVRVKHIGESLAGKVALVCGGNRGLGADLTAALALAGCRVYASFHSGAAAAGQLATKLAERQLAVEFLQGDAGDPAWCAAARETLRARHGRLDILALNACSPPIAHRLTVDTLPHFNQYLNANLPLACGPLATFLPLLDESRGTIVCSSSSAVADAQPGLAHFVALKQAVEGTVRAAICENSHVQGLIVRSPRLMTNSNDSPAGARDAIPSEWVAAHVVRALAAPGVPGQAAVLAEFPGLDAAVESPWVDDQFCPGVESEQVTAEPLDSKRCSPNDPESIFAVEAESHEDVARPADAGTSPPSVLDDEFWPEQPVEDGERDPSKTLVRIDRLIESELGRVSSAGLDSESVLVDDENDRPLLPVWNEAVPWHEGQGAPAADSIASNSMTFGDLSESRAADGSTPQVVDTALQEPSVEQRLEELVHVLQLEGAVNAEAPVIAESVAVDLKRPVVVELPVAEETPAAPETEFDGAVASRDESAIVHPERDDSSAEAQRDQAVVYSERAEPVEITAFTPGVESELFEFHQQTFPGERRDRFIARWLWKHVESARRLGVEPQAWLCRKRGAIVGHNAAVPVRIRIGDTDQLVAWIGDTAIVDSERRDDIGFRLLAQVSDELPFCLSLGQSEKTRGALLQLGWVEVAPLTTAELVIHPDAVQKGKLPGPGEVAADWGLRVSTAVKTMLHHRPYVEAQHVARFDERHDRLWNTASRDITCGVVRNATYLNWKYVDQPGQDVVRLEIVEQGKLCGIVVLLFRQADDDYPYRYAFLADLVAPLSDERLLQQIVQIASTAAGERDADALICQHLGQPLTRALRQNGFRIYEPHQYLLVNVRQLPLESRANVLASKNWFITPGDAEFCA